MNHDFTEDEFHGKLDLSMWRRILGRSKRYKRNWIALGTVAIGAAIGDASFALLTMLVIDEAVKHGVSGALWTYIGAYVASVTFLCVCVWVFIYNAGKISRYLSHDIRSEAFDKLQTLSFSYYDRRPVGWIMSRLTSDCDRLSQILAWGMLDLLWGICVVTLMSVVMLILNWKLALIVLAVVPPLLIVSKFFQKRILLMSRKIRKSSSIITASYNESLMGVRTTKTLVREQDNLGEFKRLSTDMYDHSMRNAILSAVYLPIVTSLGAAAAGAVIWFGGVNAIAGTMTLGALIAFISYATQFFGPIGQMARIITEMQGAQSSGERVMGLLETEPDVKDSEQVIARMAEVERTKAEGEKMTTTIETNKPSDFSLPTPGLNATFLSERSQIAFDGYADTLSTIEFRHVDFAYQDGTPVLDDFNLTVRPGQTIALVGPTGGGKSTIVNLVCRFYQPTAGQVLIDGVDYRERSLHWLQSNLGIVLQTPHLFSGSIKENIRYGRLDATDEEVHRAAQLVNAHDFIADMKDGYDTEVGEGGGRLSTGQKQLISFARAILADPRVFVMDEATSSIDTETEHLIQQGLERILEGRISFVIAHRLSTIRAADRILVIEGGRIAEQGTHAELIAERGKYFALYTSHARMDAE